MAESCLTSISRTTGDILNNKLSKYPSLSFLLTPTKLSFLASCPSWVCLQNSKFSPLTLNAIPLVARASIWAQQEEETEEQQREEIVALADGVGPRKETFKDAVDSENNYLEPVQEAGRRRMYVGNLDYAVDSERLAQLFNQAGIVEAAEVMYKRRTKQSKGFGFVTMSTIEESQRAIGIFHRYNLNGRLLFVNKAAPRGSRPREPRLYELGYKVCVGNLPWEIDDSRLEQIFSGYGKVVNARTVRDQETGRSRGFGFVTMSSERELQDAIAALDGQNLYGKEIRVSIAEERPRWTFLSNAPRVMLTA